MICKKNIAAAVAILFMLLALLTACRSSPVLMETLYQQQASEVDENQDALDPEDEGQEDSQFDNEKRDDADTQRDTDPNRGINDENNQGAADEAADVDQSENQNLQNYALTTVQPSAAPSSSPAPDSSASSETNTGTSSDVQTVQEGDPSTEGGDTSSEDGDNPDSDSPQDTSPGTSEDTSTQPPDDPDPRTRQITADDGTVVGEVPENVSKVTAVGAAAQLVEIAGEDGTLLGTNSDLLNNSLAQLAFSDYSNIQAWWNGDGSGSPDNFDAILATSPEVCFVISGQDTFTSDQLAQLNAQRIAVVTLYPFTSFNNLKYNMRIVGEVLTRDDTSEAGAYDPTSIVESYCSWVDEMSGKAADLAQAYGGTYPMSNSGGDYEVTGTVNTLYIAGWDDEAAYEIGGTAGSLLSGLVDNYGYGLAYAYSPVHKEFISAAMTAAGLNNESTRIKNKHRDSDFVYVTPMFHQWLPTVSGSKAAYYDGGGDVSVSADLFVTRMYENMPYQLGVNTGVCQFPAIVVASEDVKNQLSACWFWQFHGTDVYLEDGGQAYYCGISGNYSIYVNPQNTMVSWQEGSAESPIESVWLACKFSGSSIDDAWNAMVSFYSDFYGVSLDDSWRDSIFVE